MKCLSIFLVLSVTLLPAELKKNEVEKRIKISSNSATHDMVKNLIFLDGKVKVIDGELTINCDKMTIEKEEKGGMKFVVAEQNVVIVKGEMTATGDRAEYYVSDKRIELTGKPKIVKKDSVTGEESITEGSKIIFFRDKQVVTVESMTGNLPGNNK